MRPDGETIAVTPPSSKRLGQRATSGPTTANTGRHISSPRSDFARSHLPNWIPPIPITQEPSVLTALKAEWTGRSDEIPIYEGYNANRPILIADLESFEIYRSPDSGYEGRRLELISLHYLEVPNPKKLCFDGFLCLGKVKHFVQGLTIQDSSIEGYGNDESPGVVAFVRSESASKDSDYDIWFRLKTPTEAYKRFHDPFMWVAQLAKHVLDFMEEQPERSVGLRSFHDVFQQWLLSRFGQDPVYQTWHVPFHNQTDFRVAVNAYIEFLYHQAFNLPNSKSLLKHPLWADCMARGLTAIKKQPQLVDYTLATPAVYRNFKDLYFGEKIRPMRISDAVRNQQDRRKRELGFQVNDPPLEQSSPICQPYGTSPIKVGDVVAFDPDKEDQQLWRDANWEWLAYVQNIELLSSDVQRLFVLYLYRPRETNIFKAKYPFENELFFSDNCNCTEGHLLSTDVNGKYEIDWMPSTIKSTTGFFIRQTYVTQESAFLTFKEEHKTCICRKRNSSATSVSYHPGDTVYMTKTVGGHKILEPVVIRHIDKTTGATTVRKLLRLSRDCAQLAEEAKRDGKSAANELVLTDDYEMVPASRIQRRCHIRFVKKKHVLRNCIPFPYNRGGAGDLWFLSMGIITTYNSTPRLVFLSRLPDKFNEGPDMAASIHAAKLLGLSIFSGGGNLDRGLEEGGAVEFRTAVDLDAQAIHTQRANAKDPSQLKLFYGSVDDFLKAALLGQEHPLVARIGEVNFIAAGSPCPGFSLLQRNFLSEQSLRNASHISTLCSFVDHYRPEYAVLENVVSMASTRTGFEDQNVLSQLVACLVSMGYQVNQYIMDSWSYGSGQQRSRVFLTIAAPGLQPIIQPWHTHSRPYEDTTGKSLGRLPNGQKFGEREHYPTPFPHLTAGSITLDLPDIGNGNVKTCIPFPDHRVSKPPGRKDRALLACIPLNPPGSGYKEAFRLGLVPHSLQKSNKETGKAFKRIREAGLIPTITTGLSIQDSRNGASVHYREHRPITILEARRAQGYLDEEPIIGNLGEQYRIVGNGVDRKVSFALGMAVRQAVQHNTSFEPHFQQPVDEMLVDVEEPDDVGSTVSASSIIHVEVPSHEGAMASGNTTANFSKQPTSGRDPSASSGINDTDDSGILMLDGASDTRDIEHDVDEATAQPAPKPGIVSRIRRTITSRMASLALHSRAFPPSLPIAPALQSKRAREDGSRDERKDYSGDADEIVPRKRAKTKDVPPISEFMNDTIVVKGRATDTDQVVSRMRHTRHSGLEPSFAPKQWNVRPEKEHAKRNRKT